jgi:DUF1365 family protein
MYLIQLGIFPIYLDIDRSSYWEENLWRFSWKFTAIQYATADKERATTMLARCTYCTTVVYTTKKGNTLRINKDAI